MNSKVYTWAIVALVCLNLFTCTRSCNRTRSLKEQMNMVLQKDSIIADSEKRCDSLRNIIGLKNAEIDGYKQTIGVQKEAMDQIVESKKNINVTVQQKRVK